MTTSTAPKSEKKPKVKGPIRWEAVIPALVLTLLVGGYFKLFFDGHVRRVLEYVGTQVNGAEVNVGHFRTSFFGASLEMGDIQVTDKNKPARNLVQVGSIRFKMLWDALLRAKVVIDEASILNIQALTPRKSPGYVVPPPPPGKGDSVIEKAQAQVLAQTRKQFNQNFLGDVAAVLGGVDPKEQLKNIQAEFKSDARIKVLEKELADKKVKWEKQIKELPQAQELKQYEARVKALKFDVNNPAQLAQSLKEADRIIKEVDAKAKLVEQTSKDVNGEVNAYTQAYKDLEQMIQEDIRDLQTRLKLPKLDSKEFSQQLFMSLIEGKLVSLQKYIAIAREYMPPKKTEAQKLAKQEEAIVPRRRGEGKNYRFPITTGYPLFWLKNAAISSELGTSELSGDIKGEIIDLSTDQVFLKRATKINLAGNFPKQNVHGVDARITLDHTTDQPKEGLVLKVAKFPTGSYQLSDSSDVKLGIADSTGSSQLIAALVNEELTVDIRNQFTNVQYNLEAKNKHVHQIIDGILKGIPQIDLNANVRGSFKDFSLHINSNLGEELAKGFQKQLQAKLAEAQAQLRAIVDQRIGKEREKLKAEMDKTIGQLTKDLGVKKEEVDKVIKEAKAQIEGEKGKGSGKKLENEGKKLLKKLKIGG